MGSSVHGRRIGGRLGLVQALSEEVGFDAGGDSRRARRSAAGGTGHPGDCACVSAVLDDLGLPGRRDLVDDVLEFYEPQNRPNATLARLAILAGAGLLPGQRWIPGAGPRSVALAVMITVVDRMTVRSASPVPVPVSRLTTVWMSRAPLTGRTWAGNRLGPIPRALAQALESRWTADRVDALLELGGLYSARLGGDLVEALAELLRVNFPAPAPPGLDDPFLLAAHRIGRPLTSEECSWLALRLLGCGERPEPRLVGRVAELLDRYPAVLQSPLHAAVAVGAAEAPGALPLAWEVLEKLFGATITVFLKRARRIHMLTGARPTGASVDLLADTLTATVVDWSCRCQHHDGRIANCRARRDGTGSACGGPCCRHSLGPWLDPPDRADLLEPLGLGIVRMVSGRVDGEIRSGDLSRSLLPAALVRLGPQLEWITGSGSKVSFDILTGPVLFAECGCGLLHEGQTCPSCHRPTVAGDGSLRIKRGWIFAREVDGWFRYQTDTVWKCPGAGCDRYFTLDREASPCRCGTHRRLAGPRVEAWAKKIVREEPSDFWSDFDVVDEDGRPTRVRRWPLGDDLR